MNIDKEPEYTHLAFLDFLDFLDFFAFLAGLGERHTDDKVKESDGRKDVKCCASIVVGPCQNKDVDNHQHADNQPLDGLGQGREPPGQQWIAQVTEEQGAQEPRELVVGEVDGVGQGPAVQ